MSGNEAVAALAEYGIRTGLMSEEDRIYAENRILNVMKMDEYQRPASIPEAALPEILAVLLDDAAARGLTENSVVYRDLFDTELMNCLMPRPSEVQKTFRELYQVSPEKATDYFYKLSQDSNYIRRDRVARDLKWKTASDYGDLDITINLSKPEKDPKAIAAARSMKQSGSGSILTGWRCRSPSNRPCWSWKRSLPPPLPAPRAGRSRRGRFSSWFWPAPCVWRWSFWG